MKPLLIRTLVWFGIYVAVVFGFSLVYWGLYLKGPHNFRVTHSAFNQAFLELQDQIRLGERLKKELEAELRAYGIDEEVVFVSPGDDALTQLRDGLCPGEDGVVSVDRLASTYGLSEQAGHRVQAGIGRYHQILSEIERTYARLALHHADVYTEVVYEDFIYFSASTISTLGYGDIVPNTTQARRLVFCEILLGLFLTLFFIHFLMSWRRKQPDES